MTSGPPKPIPYFFYGSLTFPPQRDDALKRPLYLPSPNPRPATLNGYKIMLWGPFPTLLPSEDPNVQVKGVVVDIYPEEEAKLQYYETSAYRPAEVIVKMDREGEEQGKEGAENENSGEEVVGKTFVWKGKLTELKEGNWSLETWKRLMGYDEE